jgi:transcriptional regulator of acetoin/glycerol metabolism
MPTPNNPDLAAMRLKDPAALRAKLQASLAEHGNVDKACRALGISRRSFFRYMKEKEEDGT